MPEEAPEQQAPSKENESDGFIIDEAADEVLRLQLDRFEGPFEVLLYLIKTQEIDIFDIPIVQVTEQYLRFLEMLREEDLDVAGEFLVLAATLIQIKARMILPVEVEGDEDEEIEEEDPRLELVEKLLEYRKFRDLGERLGDLAEARADCYPRFAKPQPEIIEEEELSEVSLYDLVQAIRNVLRYVREPYIQRVQAETYSVEQGITRIENLLEERNSVTWSELCAATDDHLEKICLFLAILELCRMNRIRAHQHQAFADIRIFPKNPEEADPLDVALA
ncbi:MAG TPA: segregation/condensation protein A [Candidatus Hydrogenedentes bacterium]|nr:segregation/condensation protein A [Candidatus Hydrogenedentota bacterium]